MRGTAVAALVCLATSAPASAWVARFRNLSAIADDLAARADDGDDEVPAAEITSMEWQTQRWELPASSSSSKGLGRGLTYALAPDLCERLLPRFRERELLAAGPLAPWAAPDCIAVGDAVARGFAAWSAHSTHISFVDVSARCEADAAAGLTPRDGWCEHAEILVSARELDVSFGASTRIVGKFELSGVRATDGTLRPGGAIASAHITFNTRNCWYVDAPACALFRNPLSADASDSDGDDAAEGSALYSRARLALLLLWLFGALVVLRQLGARAHAAARERTRAARSAATDRSLALELGRASVVADAAPPEPTADGAGARAARPRRRSGSLTPPAAPLSPAAAGGTPTARAPSAAGGAAPAEPEPSRALACASLCARCAWPCAAFLLCMPPLLHASVLVPCFECFDFGAVTAHEAGHALGFAHPDAYERAFALRTLFVRGDVPGAEAEECAFAAFEPVLAGGQSSLQLEEEAEEGGGAEGGGARAEAGTAVSEDGAGTGAGAEPLGVEPLGGGGGDAGGGAADGAPAASRRRSLMHSVAAQRVPMSCVTADDLAGLLYLYPPACAACDTPSGVRPGGVDTGGGGGDEGAPARNASTQPAPSARALGAIRNGSATACAARGAVICKEPPPSVGLLNAMLAGLISLAAAAAAALGAICVAHRRTARFAKRLRRALGALDTVAAWAVDQEVASSAHGSRAELAAARTPPRAPRVSRADGARDDEDEDEPMSAAQITPARVEALLNAHRLAGLGTAPALREWRGQRQPAPAPSPGKQIAAPPGGARPPARRARTPRGLLHELRARATHVYLDELYADPSCSTGAAGGGARVAHARRPPRARLGLAPTAQYALGADEAALHAEAEIAALVAARSPVVEPLWRAAAEAEQRAAERRGPWRRPLEMLSRAVVRTGSGGGLVGPAGAAAGPLARSTADSRGGAHPS